MTSYLDGAILLTTVALLLMAGAHVFQRHLWRPLYLAAMALLLTEITVAKYVLVAAEPTLWDMAYFDGLLVILTPAFLMFGLLTTSKPIATYKRAYARFCRLCTWWDWRVWFVLLVMYPWWWLRDFWENEPRQNVNHH